MTAMIGFYGTLSPDLQYDFNNALLSPGFQRIVHLGIETAQAQIATLDLGRGDDEVVKQYRQKRTELEFWQELRILMQQHLERVSQNASPSSG